MPKRAEQHPNSNLIASPRAWASGSECELESAKFLHAARRYIGRGQIDSEWCDSQKLLMKLAYVIDTVGWSPDWVKTLQHMLRIADRSLTNGKLRYQAVQAVHAAGAP